MISNGSTLAISVTGVFAAGSDCPRTRTRYTPALRRRDDRELVGLERPLVGGVVQRARGQGSGSAGRARWTRRVRGGQVDAQRLAEPDGDLVEPVLAGAQGGRKRHAQVQLGHGHVERVGRGRGVVELVALDDLVEDVGADDDPVLAGRGRGQVGVELGGVSMPRRDRAAEGDAGRSRGR